MSELMKDNSSNYELKLFKSQELNKSINEHEMNSMQLAIAVRDPCDLACVENKVEEREQEECKDICALSFESPLEISRNPHFLFEAQICKHKFNFFF